MKVAIVHYHLSPGGVTSVITAASRQLTNAGIAHVIIAGSAPAGNPRVRIVDGLGYRKEAGTLTAEQLLESLRQTAEDALGGPPDIWHFHNHSLGKNLLLPEVVRLLADRGERLVLQIHDLAEDGRPQNMPCIPDRHRLYPVGDRIAYAFVNLRDRHLFANAGLPQANAIHLPNPPGEIAMPRGAPGKTPLVLYPSRAIRRKNLGEFLLLALLAPSGARFAISLAPENPEAASVYGSWKSFAEKNNLPVDFGVVGQLPAPETDDPSFESWLGCSSHLASTSISEGHGLVFDEAAGWKKPLVARKVGRHAGDGIYDRILIPAGWVDADRLRHHLTASIVRIHRLYDRPLAPDFVGNAFAALRAGEHLDFGNLPEPLQRQVLLRVIHNPSAEVMIETSGTPEPARPWLADRLGTTEPFTQSSGSTGPSLSSLYQDLANTGTSDVRHISSDVIQEALLKPENFQFLLSPPPRIRAVVFDIYGTLLISGPAGIRPDPDFDPTLDRLLREAGFQPGNSPTSDLHQTVLRHHAHADTSHPEIEIREIWSETFGGKIPDPLIESIEDLWHPVSPMPGAAETIRSLSAAGIHLGILSNAQFNTLPSLDRTLDGVSALFDPDLTILSYQHRTAKPSPELFATLAAKLAGKGIAPDETLFVGNDPLQDIVPAAATGFRTALFTGHPSSLRPGTCDPDLTLRSLSETTAATSSL